MCTSLHQPLTDLPQGATLRIVNGEDRVIAVFQGQVWITQDNDLRDFFLEAGESFALDRPGLTVVQAFRDARLMVLDAKPQGEQQVNAYELQRRARAARDAAVGDALARAATALRAMLVRAGQRWASRGHAHPLAAGHRTATARG